MEQTLDQRIEKLSQTGYNLTVGKIMEDSFNSWKRIIFYGTFYVLFSYLFSSLISAFLSNTLGTSMLDLEFQNSILELSKDPAGFQKVLGVTQQYLNNPLIIQKNILGSIVNLLIYPMGAGLVYCAYQFDKKGSASFKDLIRGFQGTRFIKLLGLTLIYSVIIILSIFLLLIPVLYFIPAFILAGAFIIIDDAPLLKAIKSSFKIVNMRFGQIFSILAVSFFISKVLGVLMCGVGLIFTLPFSFAVVYSIYKNTIGTVSDSEKTDTTNPLDIYP